MAKYTSGVIRAKHTALQGQTKRQNPDHARKKKCWKNKYFETHEGFIAEMDK